MNIVDTNQFYLTIGKNIKKYRGIRNYTLEVLAEKINMTKKAVQRYETGETPISMKRMMQIASALGVEVYQLMEGTEKFLGTNINDADMVCLPIVGRISCGNGSLAYQEIEDYEPTPRKWLNGGEYFYLRVKGDSMTNARINDGDLVLIRKQDEVEDGQIAAVLIDDEAFLKRVYYRNDTIILQSENNNYPPIICDPKKDNCRIIGLLKRVVIVY